MKKELKEFLILSHCRSGSNYMSKLFQSVGWDVKHERMGKHGISSWLFTTQTENRWSFDQTQRKDFEFDKIIQVVREPIRAIPSIAYTSKKSEDIRSKYVLLYGNDIERAVQSYIGWNKLIQAQNPTYVWQLEKAHIKLGKKIGKKVEALPPSNCRKHVELTLEEIKEKVNPLLFEKLQQFIGWYNNL